MIFSFAERLVLVTYAGRLKFQGKKEQSYLRSNPALLMQAKLPFASPKIAAWHTSKWEFCHKDNLIVQIHYVPEGWKPFAGTRNLLWPGKDRGLHKKRHFLRVGDQKLMGSSSSFPQQKWSWKQDEPCCCDEVCHQSPGLPHRWQWEGCRPGGWLGKRGLFGCN